MPSISRLMIDQYDDFTLTQYFYLKIILFLYNIDVIVTKPVHSVTFIIL